MLHVRWNVNCTNKRAKKGHERGSNHVSVEKSRNKGTKKKEKTSLEAFKLTQIEGNTLSLLSGERNNESQSRKRVNFCIVYIKKQQPVINSAGRRDKTSNQYSCNYHNCKELRLISIHLAPQCTYFCLTFFFLTSF